MSKPTGYSYDAQSAAIDRKRKLAEALMQAQMPSGTQMAGGMAVKQGPMDFLAPLIQQQLGSKMGRDATGAESDLQTKRNAQLGEWLQKMPGTDPVQPVMPSTGFSDPSRQAGYEEAQTASADAARRDKLGWALQGTQHGPMGQAIGGSMLQTELATPEIKYQDAGDRLLILRNGQQIGSIAKGASPDSALSSETSRRGQDLTAATAVRGQDITQRGQDIGAATSTRGQDISAENAKASREATIEAAKIKATAGTGAKQPVLNSMEYVINQFREANKKTPTGGPMGMKGVIAGVTDYQDAAMLDNLSQQLSTELRTIFRIPGEGSLSDKEQAQYGLQLPGRRYDATQNEKIMQDLLNRARIRLGQQPQEAGQGGGADAEFLKNLSDADLLRQLNGG